MLGVLGTRPSYTICTRCSTNKVNFLDFMVTFTYYTYILLKYLHVFKFSSEHVDNEINIKDILDS